MAVNTVRGFIFYIVLAITVIPVCFIVLILTPFTRAETRYGVMRAWGRFVIAALRVICGVRVQVKGMENCPKGPGLYVRNGRENIILYSKNFYE